MDAIKKLSENIEKLCEKIANQKEEISSLKEELAKKDLQISKLFESQDDCNNLFNEISSNIQKALQD